jgi:hypothetical protein
MWLATIAIHTAITRGYDPATLRQLLLIVLTSQAVRDEPNDAPLIAEYTAALTRARSGQLN